MRHVGTYGLHRVAPCVDYVPGGIHVSKVGSLPQRSVPEPYGGPVSQSGLRAMGYLVGAAYRYSLGYTSGVPLLGGRCPLVIARRVGGYGVGPRLVPSPCRCLAFDFLYCAVSLPKLGSTIALWVCFPRVSGSAFLGVLLPVCASVPFP